MNEKDRLMALSLEGRLAPVEARRLQELLEHPEARQELTSLEAVDGLLAELGEAPIPEPAPDLARRVLARAALRAPPRRSALARAQRWLAERPLRLGASFGAAAAAGVVVGLLLAGGPPPPDATAVRVQFLVRAPEAQRVSLVGSFNGWDETATPMQHDGSAWRISLPLERGRYEYQFVVDGRTWLTDPAAPHQVDDGFGGKNGVIEI